MSGVSPPDYVPVLQTLLPFGWMRIVCSNDGEALLNSVPSPMLQFTVRNPAAAVLRGG